jgi:hypothetical protein
MVDIRNDLYERGTKRIGAPFIPAELPEVTEESTLVTPPDPFDRSKTTPAQSLEDAYRLIMKVLEFAREYDGLSYPINFSMEYPPVDSELPCFTAKLLDRGPLVINGRKEISPRFMQEYPDLDYPGQNVREYMRRQQNTVQIILWTKTVKTGNEMSEWLEDKFYEYLFAFQWGGLSHPIQWLGRGEDRRYEVRGQTVFAFPTNLIIITAKKTVVREAILRKIDLKVTTSP